MAGVSSAAYMSKVQSSTLRDGRKTARAISAMLPTVVLHVHPKCPQPQSLLSTMLRLETAQTMPRVASQMELPGFGGMVTGRSNGWSMLGAFHYLWGLGA